MSIVCPVVFAFQPPSSRQLALLTVFSTRFLDFPRSALETYCFLNWPISLLVAGPPEPLLTIADCCLFVFGRRATRTTTVLFVFIRVIFPFPLNRYRLSTLFHYQISIHPLSLSLSRPMVLGAPPRDIHRMILIKYYSSFYPNHDYALRFSFGQEIQNLIPTTQTNEHTLQQNNCRLGLYVSGG